MSQDTTLVALTGLTALPSQVWGAIRLVPLVREEPITDIRLDDRLYGDDFAAVAVDRRTAYCSYIPHGYVANWTDDGTPASSYGTQLRRDADGPRPACVPLRFHRRMARRVDKNRVRFLPLHLALEGYLALHFGGPAVVWEEWSHRAVSRGLSPRVEQAYVGAEVEGLRDALRVFEIHPGQCGVMVYAADALAAAFVVPHPDDYRALHPSLVLDLFGELIHHYTTLHGPVPEFRARIRDGAVGSLAELRAEAARHQREWAEFHDHTMAGGLLDESYTLQRVRTMGPFALSRFLPPFHRNTEQHIGETITHEDGRLAYLKTFRLSEAQTRRGHLLTLLAAHDWHFGATADALGVSRDQLATRVEHAGFGALLRQDIRDHYRAAARRAAT
ncbi:ARPP-2 domain-containing protein [Streptomyces milbemycinicus]|uniref:ARPP-2 domain-containing protein n=1 Tax=Streptomyces milbemycinicus TaxID=476552 RepID=A0ABW8LJQ6_9ACTN